MGSNRQFKSRYEHGSLIKEFKTTERLNNIEVYILGVNLVSRTVFADTINNSINNKTTLFLNQDMNKYTIINQSLT